MALLIGGNITIGSGVTISSESGPLRGLLSASGKSAYDSATADSWFAVSAADYANVQAGLSGVSTIGYTNADLSAATTPFSANFGATLNDVSSTVPVGYYVLGVVSRMVTTGILNFNPSISTTFRGTYNTIGTNVCVMNQSALPTYFLRKNPPSPVVATSYVALSKPTAGTTTSWGVSGSAVWGTGATGGAYSATLTSGSWTNFNTGLPAQQWLLTNVQQW